MRLLFPFALYLTAASYQQNPDPWAQDQQIRNYQDHVQAEVRGMKRAEIEERKMPHHKPTYEELKAENERLKTELAAAQEATADAERQMGVYYEETLTLKREIAELKKNLVEMHDGAVEAPHFGDQKWPD